jgi:hypothetical protein
MADALEKACAFAKARKWVADEGITVGSRVALPDAFELVTYVGLLETEHDILAVVRLEGDLLMGVHYSRLMATGG